MEYIRITDKTMKWYSGLLTGEYREKLIPGSGVYAIGAVADGVACGTLVFRISMDIAEILYIAVSDGYRRRGVATGMIDYLCEHAYRTTTPIICSFAAKDKTDPVYLLFLEHGGFTVGEETGFICRAPIADIAACAQLRAVRGRLKGATGFFSLPEAERRRFRVDLLLSDIFHLRDLDARRTSYIDPLCLCSMGDGDIDAAVFVERETDDDLSLSFAWCADGKQAKLIGLMAEAAARLESMDFGGYMYIAAVNEPSMGIANKLFPEREITQRFYGAVWDMTI